MHASSHDPHPDAPPPHPPVAPPPRRFWRRTGKILAWILGLLILVPAVLVALVLLAGNTGPGRRGIESLVQNVTGGQVRIDGLSGVFPSHLRFRTLALADAQGTYLTVHDGALDWSPLQLIHGELLLNRLQVAQADLARLPASGSSQSSSSSSNLPVRVVLQQAAIAQLKLAQPVAGQPIALALQASGTLESYTQGAVQLQARRLDGGGDYVLDGTIGPQALQVTAKVDEPPRGLIAGLANLPDLGGGIRLDAHITGPRNALDTRLAVQAGQLHATAKGTLDLVASAAQLVVSADAPAMTPRPDIAWQSVHLDARVHGPFTKPDATGTLRIADLRASGAKVGDLSADLSGNAGQVTLQAKLSDIEAPGPAPDLLAHSPLTLDAKVQLDAPNRPVTFALHHALLDLTGQAQTAGTLAVTATLDLPQLAPFAQAAGTALQGHSHLTLQASQSNDITQFSVRGTLGVASGPAPAPALVGDAAKLDIAGMLRGQDLTLSRFSIEGLKLAATVSGTASQRAVDLGWTLHLPDLSVLQPTLAGQVTAQGHVKGPTNDPTTTAELTGDVAAQGYQSGTVTAQLTVHGVVPPKDARLTAQGTLLDAPLSLQLTAEQQDGALQVALQQLDWKSLHGSGSFRVPQGAELPIGQLQIAMVRLQDLAPFTHQSLQGSASATLTNSEQQARVDFTVQGVNVPGTASISKGTLQATIDGLATNPIIDGTVTLDGLSVSGTSGSGRLTAKGPVDALAVQLQANANGLAGAPATVNAAAMVDGVAKVMTLRSLTGDWQQQQLRLLAPATLRFGQVTAIDRLRVSLAGGELDVAGQMAPTLDLGVHLRHLPANVASIVAPDYAATGTVNADAQLKGSPAAPTGSIKVTASGVHLRQGTGSFLPPANLTASAQLRGTSSSLDSRLTLGKTAITLTGTAPLGTQGALNLHLGGAVDLAMLNPLLSGNGRRAQGRIALALAVTGSPAQPKVGGTARLTGGDIQDYTYGAHITDIAASITGNGETIRLVNLQGKAGPGTIAMSGSVGLAGDMPIELKLTANNARPLSTDLLTALINANLTLHGNLAGDMTASGRLFVRRADIRVPEKLPQSVAVLPFQVAGAKPPPPAPVKPPAVISLNLTLDAPEQVFIRGRGLNAELGGKIGITGTTANPQPNGGLHLIRGQFSLAGQTLALSSGSVQFTGAGLTNPAINLVATSQTRNLTATVTISGSVSAPKIALSSVPEQPQDEIMAQLLFDSTTARLTPFQIAQIASALAEMSGLPGGNANPLDNIRTSLGLDRLTVGSTANGGTDVEAGRYVSRRVYVGAKQSATGSGTQATVQIDLGKGLKLETTAGTGTSSATGAESSGNAASVGLTYQFEY